MDGQKPSRAERKKQVAANQQDQAAMLTAADVKDIISVEIKALREDLSGPANPPAAKPTSGVRRKSPWVIPLITGILGNLVGGAIVAVAITKWQSSNAHDASDLKRDIAAEVATQLDQRAAKDAENLNNHIAAEVGRQLAPIHQQLEGLSQDIGKIKDNLHIAQTKPHIPSTLQRFATMDQNTFTASLSLLNTALLTPSAQSAGPDDLRAIGDKLRRTDENSPDYWPTLMQFIRVASSLTGHAAHPTGPTTHTRDSFFDRTNALDNLTVVMDGGGLQNLSIINSRIIFTDHPVKMKNITFINCSFEFPLSAQPTPQLKQAARQFLAGASLQKATIRSLDAS
jgi:hypothetical protein